MSTNLLYLINPSTSRDILDLRTEGARYRLNGVDYDYRLSGDVKVSGNSVSNVVRAAPGVSLDARQLLGGEDCIFFTGHWSNYTKTLTDDGAIVFTRTVDGQVERVMVGNGRIGVTRDLLVFADGSVRTDTVREALTTKGLAASTEDLKTQGALTDTTADDWNTQVTSGNPGALLPDNPGGSVRGFAKPGPNFALPTPGVAQVLAGSAGVDQVFVTPGATVNAKNLLGGEDRIFFTGTWADYHKTLDSESGSIILTREVNGKTEHVTVGNGLIGLTRDLLVFADGAVRTDTVRYTLAGKGSSATVDDLKAQGALTSDTVDDWREDTFTRGAGDVTIDTVSGDDQVNAAERNAGVTVSGRAAAGSAVELEWGGTRKSVTADTEGKWSAGFDRSEVPADGNSTITAAGKTSINTRAVVVDTVAPKVPTIDDVTGDNRITAAERAAGFTLTGTAEPDGKVLMNWFFGTSSTEPAITKTVAVDSAGRWSMSVSSSEFPSFVGPSVVYTHSIDKAGNTHSYYTQIVQVEAPAPAASAIDTMANMVIGA
ncbi:hypothetical protein SAMN05660489_02413 [Pseudomonas sp. LAMO17WK12:I10]|uniref:hypothetical protein n=1 Tax=unclassified Pseudomonas TaxID=196821 RepID=UPI000BC89BA6|nr:MULTISPECIES: hypothetical protein [unclassified Pseudomonas]PXX71820.1 hypothetical protein H160_02498 [Pseudomonas sp. LAMO17WK12:I9]SNY29186.1 hypothetical protein SAMN05660489_02413 [Pseudomonas sp. LAMO17WK12:I10]